jgi:small subunit ribosomal protein S15
MALSKEQKQELITKYGVNDKDTGRTEVQIAILTEEILLLTVHMKANHKDNHTKLGLQKKVSQRRSLLVYLKRENFDGYKNLIKELGLKDNV